MMGQDQDQDQDQLVGHGETTPTPERPAMPHGRGGCRPGSGRPRRTRFCPIHGDLDFARNFLSFLMRDPRMDVVVRLRAALAILSKGSSRGARPVVGDLGLPEVPEASASIELIENQEFVNFGPDC
jgi:hypothetical protein